MPIHYEKDGAVATFTIDNGKVNVFTPAMHRELFVALTDFIADPALRSGILTGAPDRSFSAGDDVKTPLPELTPQAALEAHLFPHSHEAAVGLARPGWERDVLHLRRYKPIVGAVDGYCLGQGLIYLLMLTDIRIATPRAEFGFPEVAYGMGGAVGMARLGTQIPHVVAMEMMLFAERLSATKALEAHLINRVVPVPELMREARQAADRIASHPPIAVRVDMEAYQRSREMPPEQFADYVDTLFRFQRTAFGGIDPQSVWQAEKRSQKF